MVLASVAVLVVVAQAVNLVAPVLQLEAMTTTAFESCAVRPGLWGSSLAGSLGAIGWARC